MAIHIIPLLTTGTFLYVGSKNTRALTLCLQIYRYLKELDDSQLSVKCPIKPAAKRAMLE